MHRKLAVLLVLLLGLTTFGSSAAAQTAAFNSFGTACPNAQATLQIQGVPRLGSNFTVSGILFPSLCTRKFCPCTCCKCNTCAGSVLFLGIGKQTLQLTQTCQFLITPDIMLMGDSRGQITLPVPNNAQLLGVRFYMQRLDVSLVEITGTQCSTTYQPTALQGASNAVEGIAGR